MIAAFSLQERRGKSRQQEAGCPPQGGCRCRRGRGQPGSGSQDPEGADPAKGPAEDLPDAGEFPELLTVEELHDLVAFLQTLQ